VQTRVRKWGNSLGIRIPQELAIAAGIKENSTVELEADGENIRIKLTRLSLKEMVQQINQDNIHEEVSWGRAEGNEIW
jgi:antitoxin MazE